MEFATIDLPTTSSTTITNTTEAKNTVISVDNFKLWDAYLWSFIKLVLFIGIFGGNVLTIIAISICRRLRSVISNMFVCSLAVADLIVGLSLPYHLSFYLGSNWGNVHGLCLTRFYLIIFACCVSILTLIAISIDRYIAIIYPLHYMRYMTHRLAIYIITIAWSVGAAVAAVPMFWNNWNTAFHCEFNEVLPPWYIAGIITPGFVMIWMLMFFMYWRIMKEAHKQSKQMKNAGGNHKSNYHQSDWKSVQVVLFIMGSFSICWLPFLVVACAQIFKVCTLKPFVYKTTFSLAMTNSVLNPVIYGWKTLSFRQAFKRLLHCKSPNRYQTSPELSKNSPLFEKHHKSDLLRTKKISFISNTNIICTKPNERECANSITGIEIGRTNNNTLQIKLNSLSKQHTVTSS